MVKFARTRPRWCSMPTTAGGTWRPSMSAELAPRTLFVTNDFPPRIGGAQSYYWGAIRALEPIPRSRFLRQAHVDAAAFDATHPYTVVRASTSVLWPTAAVLRSVAARGEGRRGACDFGHPLPAGLMGPQLKKRCGIRTSSFSVARRSRCPAPSPE